MESDSRGGVMIGEGRFGARWNRMGKQEERNQREITKTQERKRRMAYQGR